MAEKKIRLRVLTPSQTVVDEDVDFVTLRGHDGEMGVLPGHEPWAVALAPGVLRAYRQKREVHILALLGGMASVGNAEVTVLTPVAEHPDHIEEVLERLHQERAENARHEHLAEAEIQRAESALRRTLVGVDIGAHTVIDQFIAEDEEGDA